MIKCLVFNRRYFDINTKTVLHKNVKYRIKDENYRNYITIKKIKIPKFLENKLYNTYLL